MCPSANASSTDRLVWERSEVRGLVSGVNKKCGNPKRPEALRARLTCSGRAAIQGFPWAGPWETMGVALRDSGACGGRGLGQQRAGLWGSLAAVGGALVAVGGACAAVGDVAGVALCPVGGVVDCSGWRLGDGGRVVGGVTD